MKRDHHQNDVTTQHQHINDVTTQHHHPNDVTSRDHHQNDVTTHHQHRQHQDESLDISANGKREGATDQRRKNWLKGNRTHSG